MRTHVVSIRAIQVEGRLEGHWRVCDGAEQAFVVWGFAVWLWVEGKGAWAGAISVRDWGRRLKR